MSRRGRPCRSRLDLLLGVAAIGLLSVAARAQVNGQPPPPVVLADAELPSGQGSDTLRRRCLRCHATDLIRQQRLSRAGWERELAKMIGWGAAVEDSERTELVDYLAEHFAAERPSTNTDGVTGSGAAQLDAKCRMCHDLSFVEAQRLDRSGWGREVDKMINWGARVDASEKDLLVQYLATRFGPRPQDPR